METSEKILVSARELFTDFGYRKVSMDEIASNAGVTKKTVYSYFKDKDFLLKCLIEEEILSLKKIVDFYSSDESLDPFSMLNKTMCSLLRYKKESKLLSRLSREINVYDTVKAIDNSIVSFIKDKLLFFNDRLNLNGINIDYDLCSFIIYKVYLSIMFEYDKDINEDEITFNVTQILKNGLFNKQEGFMKLSEKIWFKYVVIIGVLFIPFMYSFFYLKAYWNPYGEGNMDNIPVAIVNLDSGDKGNSFVSKLVESGKLDFQIVSSEEATTGLYDKRFYAVITIPSDFSSNLESAMSDDKVPAIITYAPNQKSNYLASQIISRVLVVAEEEARGEVSSNVVSGLVSSLSSLPDRMIELSNGAVKLEEGALSLSNGLDVLDSKYGDFNAGIDALYNGSVNLNNGLNEVNGGINSLKAGSSAISFGINQINDVLANTDLSGIDVLVSGIDSLNMGVNGESGLVNGVNGYVNGASSLANGIISLDNNIDLLIMKYSAELDVASDDVTRAQLIGTIGALQQIKASINGSDSSLVDGANMLVSSGDSLVNGVNAVSVGVSGLSDASDDIASLGAGINSLRSNLVSVGVGANSLNSGISKLNDGVSSLYSGSTTLNDGLFSLNSSSEQIKLALDSLSSGSDELYSGINTLRSSVDDSISSSQSELSKLDGLSDFVSNSVSVNEAPVNSIDSYGTAFGPFFMSIALWVGSLMLFIVLYYDASDRFKLLGRNASNKFLRTLCYLGLASLQGLSLGILLMIGLDLVITNYFLYFSSLILVACLFESIMEFLIVNFGDIGKFLSLILLVLQLAAAGGTFPIETVTRSFRFLNPLLPMKYTCDLFKEGIISIEGSLLSRSLVVIVIWFILLLLFNLFRDWKSSRAQFYKQMSFYLFVFFVTLVGICHSIF